MRAIDNYTDKEREILALKGMTAPRTSSERPAPNKAQHSPLPWHRSGKLIQCETTHIAEMTSHDWAANDAALIVRAVNYADKLAEALRDLRSRVVATGPNCLNTTKADAALAAYESDAQ